MTRTDIRTGTTRVFVGLIVVAIVVLCVASAGAGESRAEGMTGLHQALREFDDSRALAMRGLKQAQDLKCVYLYGRGFGLDMPEAVPEDMLIEGLWLFDYLEAMDLTAMSLLSYATAADHPYFEEELRAFRAFVPEAASRTLAYYDETARALADAKARVNEAGMKGVKIETLPRDPLTPGPNEGIAGDGFRVGWSWGVEPHENEELARYYKQHGYTPDQLYDRAKAYGIDYIAPNDGDIFSWRTVEPAEQGVFDWSRADVVLGRFKKYGIGLWLPIAAYSSSPPAWLRERLGNKAVLVDDNGKPIVTRAGGSGSFGSKSVTERNPNPPNFFNPDVSKAFAGYIAELTKHIREAGVEIIAVNLGGADLKYGGPEARARKQAWLKQHARAPAEPKTEAQRRLAVIDEARWRQHEYVEYFRPVVNAIRAAAPDLPIAANAGCAHERNEVRGPRNNELLVQELGIVPTGGSTESIWDDLRRSMSGTHFSVAHTHSGGGNAFAQYAFSGYIHGSLAIHSWPTPILRAFFWPDHIMYNDFRPKWSTLFDWRRFHERAQGMAPEMLNTVPAPQAAILWSRTTDFHQSFTQDWGGGTYGFGNGPANYHRIGCVGWDRLLNMANLTHDMVTERQAADGALSRYELLVMPAVQALPADVAEAIRKFVGAGGKVITTSAPALFADDMERKEPGQLAEVFGADFDQFIGETVVAGTPLKIPAVHEAMYLSIQTPKESDLKRTLYCTFKPRGGATVADNFTDGRPAVVLNQFGQGSAAVIGYPVGREFFMCDTYHMHYGHNWPDFPNGAVFQQAICRYVEGLMQKMNFQPMAVVAYEWAPRSADRAAGWPAWQWPRTGGGYTDYVWKTCSLQGSTVGRQWGHADPRSVETAFRAREGNPNLYMTLFSREGAYGFDPGVIHFAAISKLLKMEVHRQDIRHLYDLSVGCPVPTKIEKGRTTFHTMIEPSMARMFVLATADDTVRLYEGKRVRGGTDAELRYSVAAAAANPGPLPERVVVGAEDIAQFIDDRGPNGITISCESPMWLPSARKLAKAIEAKYGRPARITRTSPRIEGSHNWLGVWRHESHRFIERPDIVLGNRTESHYVAAYCIASCVGPDAGQRPVQEAPLPIVTTHSFPGPGRCAVTLTRPYRKRKLGWRADAKEGEPDPRTRLWVETPAPDRSLIIGGSDAAGVDAGVDAVIKLLGLPVEKEPSAKAVPPAHVPPSVRKPAGDLHELDMSRLPPECGSGGMDPMGGVPGNLTYKQVLNYDGKLSHLAWPPSAGSHLNGFYFTGPGKILPEAALRIYRPDQLCEIRSETRKEDPWTDKYWDGPDDCSAVAWMVRDEKGFTIRIHVTDDKFVSTNEEEFFNNDSVQLFFDVRRQNRGAGPYGPGVFQINLAPKKPGKVEIAPVDERQKVPGVTAACRFFDGGYRMKVFVPIESITAKHVYPEAMFNFDFCINDSDTPGERDSQLAWSADQMAFMDARVFGRMRPVRRGYYFTEGDVPPAAALLRAETRFHVRGGEKWKGPEDCSAVAWLRKGKDALTFHIDVTDDIIDTSHQYAWLRDRLSLHFDLRPEGQLGRSHYDRGVFELSFPVNKGGGEVEVFSNGARNRRTPVPGTTATCKVTETGYSMDVVIPYEGLRVNQLVPGERFNFDFKIDDADSPNGWDSTSCWAGSRDNLQSPCMFGRMEPVAE